MKKCIYFGMVMFTILLSNRLMAQKDQKTNILILIDSDQGGTYKLALEIMKGIQKTEKANAEIRLVRHSDHPLLEKIPVAKAEQLADYDGIAFGSPVYFGNMSTAMSAFLSGTVAIWQKHLLEGKPATVFMSAGGGAGRELAMQSFYNSLAVHGMVLVTNGIRGTESLDTSLPQGNSVLGAGSLAALKDVERPTGGERTIAQAQGENFAKVATALKGLTDNDLKTRKGEIRKEGVDEVLKKKGIVIPEAPNPVGNYTPYSRSGNLVFINQVALLNGKVVNPGKVGADVSENDAKIATRQTMMNVIAVLKNAAGGNLDRVRCIQLTGIFNTTDNYTQHANLMNIASDLTVEIFGDKGKHARATLGASSLPVNSCVEIQAVFEIEN